MAPYRPNRKTRRNKKYKKLMSEETNNNEVKAPEVNLGDIQACLQIIDIVTERGALKGPELSSVGVIRDRLAAFVDFNTPKDEVTDSGDEPAPDLSESNDGAAATEEI